MDRITGVILVLMLGLGAVVLMLNGRQERINRQLQAVFPNRPASSNRPSIRRDRVGSHWSFFHKLVGYQPEALYYLPPISVIGGGIALWAVITYAGWFLGFPTFYVSIAGAVVALLAMRSLFNWQRRRVASKLFRQLPDVLELVTSTVRAGLPVVKAFEVISRDMAQPTAGQFSRLCDELAIGVAPEDGLDRIYQRTGVTEYGMFAVTLAVQMKSGGRLAETLQVLAETVRQRVALSGRAKALAADPIFSSRALSIAPFAFGGILSLINPDLVNMLWTDPTGRILFGYALASVFCGIFVIRWMVRKGTSL